MSDSTWNVFRCSLCWATFDGPGDLAAHEQEEHTGSFRNSGPSVRVPTRRSTAHEVRGARGQIGD